MSLAKLIPIKAACVRGHSVSFALNDTKWCSGKGRWGVSSCPPPVGGTTMTPSPDTRLTERFFKGLKFSGLKFKFSSLNFSGLNFSGLKFSGLWCLAFRLVDGLFGPA